MMRLQVRFFVIAAAVAGFALCAGTPTQAQNSSSSQQPAAVQTDNQAPAAPEYIQIDPLAKVRYDNRYDVSLGMAYDHMKAGPNILQGANLGGLDVEGSYWLTRHLGIQASGRAYLGTSGAGTNDLNIKGPFVAQYFFVAGPELLGPHNKHAALIAHIMAGGVRGQFEKDLRGNPPAAVDFYKNQVAPAVIAGAHIDLNRSEHWVFRITQDMVLTDYEFNDAPYSTSDYRQFDLNYAISVGWEYKFTRAKRSTRKANWVSGW
jgi:hypothetical protein